MDWDDFSLVMPLDDLAERLLTLADRSAESCLSVKADQGRVTGLEFRRTAELVDEVDLVDEHFMPTAIVFSTVPLDVLGHDASIDPEGTLRKYGNMSRVLLVASDEVTLANYVEHNTTEHGREGARYIRTSLLVTEPGTPAFESFAAEEDRTPLRRLLPEDVELLETVAAMPNPQRGASRKAGRRRHAPGTVLATVDGWATRTEFVFNGVALQDD